jgi:hypothetical protein
VSHFDPLQVKVWDEGQQMPEPLLIVLQQGVCVCVWPFLLLGAVQTHSRSPHAKEK